MRPTVRFSIGREVPDTWSRSDEAEPGESGPQSGKATNRHVAVVRKCAGDAPDGGVGFPWLTVDLEHSPIDWSDAGVLFGAIADAGCVPLARVPCGDHDHIKRVLDAGAWGIVVPMVDTVEEAKAAIAAAKYPPVGNRSVGGSLHAINFGAASGDYYKHANEEILVVLQTESPRGVHNAEAIYSLKGVDAIFVGPERSDRPMRDEYGKDPTHEELEAMLQRVPAIGKKSARRSACTCSPWKPSKSESPKAGSSSRLAAICG